VTAAGAATVRGGREKRAGPRQRARHGACTGSGGVTRAAGRSDLDKNNHTPISTAAIVGRHHQSVLRFLRRRGAGADDALDIAQETYVRFLRYEGATTIEFPAAMLFRIAGNVAADHARAASSWRQRSLDADAHDFDLPSEQPSAERELAAEQILEAVRCVIAALSPQCRKVFLLSRVEGLTYAEIALRCGVSVKTVEKHVSHALRVCGELL
jgi:RNA polymerase sigma factor (sigma-70 family)